MNAEERGLLKTFEPGDLSSGANAEDKMKTARQAARDTLSKTRRVNLGVTKRDFNLVHGTRGSDMGKHSLSDAFVEHHVQVFVGG